MNQIELPVFVEHKSKKYELDCRDDRTEAKSELGGAAGVGGREGVLCCAGEFKKKRDFAI